MQVDILQKKDFKNFTYKQQKTNLNIVKQSEYHCIIEIQRCIKLPQISDIIT